VSTGLALLVFAVSLGATLFAASVFAERLDVLGHRLQLPEALIGVLTAAGADAPELASAVVALAQGSHAVGIGVVVGSNVFNIAAMLGLSAVVVGRVRLAPEALALEGGVALLVTAIVALLVFGVLPAWATVLLVVLVLVPYGIVVSVAEGDRPRRLSLRQWRHLRRSLGGTDHRQPVPRREVLGPMLVIPPAVAAIVLGSIGMVHSALTLADRWGLPDAVVGAVLLAVLTSLPNAYTGIRLGRARRGAALVSETMNSNTINLVGGLAIPALFVTLGGFSALAVVDFSWLLVVTAVAILLLARRSGMGMRGGVVLLAAWVGFAVVQGIWG
jgi:cation:H+ antiporter